MTALRPGHSPDGYRSYISPRPTILLHLSRDGARTLCGQAVTPRWQEPAYTQRTKCRPCWMKRAEEVAG